VRALVVKPGVPSSAELRDVPEPDPGEGELLVEVVAVGVCGTDREIVGGSYGQPPDGSDHLVLGHESLGRVREAPEGSGVQPGDLVVGIVRRPDPVPCPACAVGEWDMCRNGRYTEHGIKGLDGFLRERYRAAADAVVRIDPSLEHRGVLLEPTSVVAKAWHQVDLVGSRSRAWQPRTAVVTGAGPIGLLAAMIGVQRGLDVHVLDVATDGPKPGLVADLGATYHSQPFGEVGIVPDVVIEATGVSAVVAEVLGSTAGTGVVCLTGVSAPGRETAVDLGEVNREIVLGNEAVVGSVNANRRHYEAAAAALARAEAGWLERLLTRRVPLERFAEGLERRDGDVKTMIEL
jgi:threonine dehydrogenase-like Zn-dependent dehydrogenase